jgi:riboflavin kinase/FMN adenylyltransferase
VRLLRPDEAPPPLTWTERKAQLLADLGVDGTVAYPTDEALLALSAEDFFQRIVLDALDAKALVEGPNFRFGHQRRGDTRLLGALAQAAGLTLDVVEPLMVDGQYVSSSRIRRLIAEGDVAGAAGLLTRPYRIRGLVRHGAGRGARIGFPTANVDAIDTLIPAVGVYAGLAWVGDSRFGAAINVGPNPTFGEQALKVEVHLIDARETLYGQVLEVDFLQRLRGVTAFSDVAALQAQIARDIASARQAVADFEAPRS